MGFPSPEQEKVIKHTGKPLIVVAAPGTGKTRTIVTRMIRLLKEDPNREVSFITFTRSSRKDTDKKVKDEVGEDIFENATFEFPRVCTLHTYAKSIVHKYASLIGREYHFSILLTEKKQQYLLLKEALSDLGIDIAVERAASDINCYRCANYFPSDCPIPIDRRSEVLEYYNRLLKFYNTFDMEGLVDSACEILRKENIEFPHVFLQVDEYQDLNPKDQTLIDLAGLREGSQVVVVGDDAQSIYQFRHANYKGIKDLWNNEKWEKVCFMNCHRLPPHILRAAQALITGENYLGGSVNIPPDNKGKILTLQCTTSDIQLNAVANLIKEILNTKTTSKGKKISYRNIMILCPISSFVHRVCTTLESEFSIPTKRRSKPSIPEEYWKLLLVLRMLNTHDSLALREWLTIIGMSEARISQIRKDALRSGMSLYDYANTLSDVDIKSIYDQLSDTYEQRSDRQRFKDTLTRFAGLNIDEEMLSMIHFNSISNPENKNYLGSIIQQIYEQFGLLDEQDENTADISDEDKVLVTTMYSAKGLEAEFVFIMWMNKHWMPMPDRDIREQLRVLYVGITRAKQDIIFTFHEKHDGVKRIKQEAMSPFLQKIQSSLDIKRVMKSDL